MPRLPVALASSVAVLLTLVSGTAVGSAPDDGGTARPARPAAADAEGSGDRGRSDKPGRTPYEKRLLESRREGVDLSPVMRRVGGGDRPNILVLMLDDMRRDDLQFMPNTRRLITDQGVEFTNAVAPQPLCCPARASFFTGLYTHNHKVWSHKPPFGFRVFDDRETLPVWLQRLGYTTTYLGKYMNGYGRQQLPQGGPSTHYVPPGWTHWTGSVDRGTPGDRATAGGTYQYFDTTLNEDGRLVPHQGVYQTHLFSQMTQRTIRTQARSPKPFFAMTSFVAPHSGGPDERDDPKSVRRSDGRVQVFQTPARPRSVHGRFDHEVTAIPGWPEPPTFAGKPVFMSGRPPMVPAELEGVLEIYRQRAEAVSVVDDEVRNIIETLRRTGELDNTYVVLTSDNGYFLGEQRIRKGKTLPYDPALRLPLVVRGPGLPAGEERSDPFLMVDFAPTLLAAASGGTSHLDTPAMDGVSMLDVARRGDRGWDRPVFTETGPRHFGNRSDLQDLDFLDRPHGPSQDRFTQGVRTGRYLYVEHASRERELYDLRADPRQVTNLSGDPGYVEVERQLRRELDRLRDCRGAGCAEPLPVPLRTDRPEQPYVPDPSRKMTVVP
jgi:arylsulfatase A-like enzyme